MSIYISNNQFHLQTKNTSYIFQVYDNTYLAHLYWGEKLDKSIDLTHFHNEFIYSRANAVHVPIKPDNSMFLSDLQCEFSVFGGGDYRTPTVHVRHQNSSTVTEFVYDGYKLIPGKPKLEGLPASYSENDAESVEIYLKDKLTGFKAVLLYSVFENYNCITRSIRYVNDGETTMHLLSAQSATVDLYGTDYSYLNLYGDWLRERNMEWIKPGHAKSVIETRRGMSSHMSNPFLALKRGAADENIGEFFGFSLVYSGNFNMTVEGNSCGGTRINAGINDFNFDWTLKPFESFQTPEVIMAYSNCGLNGLSNIYHKMIRERLCKGRYRDKPRPMVINNWEGTGPDFTEEKLIDIAKNGAEMGLEYFVLDDGWFGNRNKGGSLGDWYVNKDLLCNGLQGVASRVNRLGMKFGVWMEPEMISPDSDLYRAHPDWCIHSEGRKRTLNREQLVLDLARSDVKEYVINAITDVLNSANISYMKWDCNRNIGETANQMQSHKYVLALYEILETITTKFPDVLFESCSGGGGRFDPGMLYYMPQTWTSDNTEPISRLSIQHGTSVVYPPITMTAHIGKLKVGADEENDIVRTSGMVAMAANFGLEMDLSLLSSVEKEQIKGYIELYKSIRNTVQFGSFYRLESPFEGDRVSWQFADDNKALLFVYQTKKQANGEERRVFLKDLQPDAVYTCRGASYTGQELMKVGIKIPLNRYEYFSDCYVFEKQ